MSTIAQDAALKQALASTERPPRASAMSAALTFGWRGMLKVKHVPEQLIDATLTPVLFLLMFTYMFGGALAGSTSEYLQYVLPGVLVISVLFTTVYSGVALNTDVTKGVVDRFRSLPIALPRRSPSSPAPASGSPASRSASPASTRCSWPSPVTPPTNRPSLPRRSQSHERTE